MSFNSYQVPLERVTISGPKTLISGETIELICESTPSYPGLFNDLSLKYFIIFFIATELIWTSSQANKAQELFYRKNSADFRDITSSKLKIKVEIKLFFLVINGKISLDFV